MVSRSFLGTLEKDIRPILAHGWNQLQQANRTSSLIVLSRISLLSLRMDTIATLGGVDYRTSLQMGSTPVVAPIINPHYNA